MFISTSDIPSINTSMTCSSGARALRKGKYRTISVDATQVHHALKRRFRGTTRKQYMSQVIHPLTFTFKEFQQKNYPFEIVPTLSILSPSTQTAVPQYSHHILFACASACVILALSRSNQVFCSFLLYA